MGTIKLQPRCPKRSGIVASVDPDPNWSLDDLFLELNSLELKLGHQTPLPLKQPQQLPESQEVLRPKESTLRYNKPFVMSISNDYEGSDDDDEDEEDSDDGDDSLDDYVDESGKESEDEVSDNESSMVGTRFSCIDIDVSDSEESDNESHLNTSPCSLMHKNSLEEGVLFEIERDHQLKVKEQVRSTLSTLELHHQKKCERSRNALVQLDKYVEEKREADRRLDRHYQRKIAEVLDDHLSAVQKDHEQRSQIEERRIRDDAAIEEAKRKEKALYEEKVAREKAIAEAKEREKAARLAEEQRVALEAAKRAAEESARKESERAAAEAAARAAEQDSEANVKMAREREEGKLSSEKSGIKVMAAPTALKAEANRLRICEDVSKGIPGDRQKDLERYGRKIARIISQIAGTREAVRSKAHDLINTINGSAFPLPIATLIFAQKVVSSCENPRGADDRFIFACARVILFISAKVPSVMDFVLAELHRSCIYTVPKHLHPSSPAARNNDYWKMIGYREEDNRMESRESYLKRMQSYMKLFAAIIQTDEVEGVRNPHGLELGWAWLAMLLNALPANRYTAFALDAFLKMAGFALYKRYKSQFVKILNVISRSYMPALKKGGDQELGEIVNRLEGYLEGKVFQKEPEGWRLEEDYLLSEEVD